MTLSFHLIPLWRCTNTELPFDNGIAASQAEKSSAETTARKYTEALQPKTNPLEDWCVGELSRLLGADARITFEMTNRIFLFTWNIVKRL